MGISEVSIDWMAWAILAVVLCLPVYQLIQVQHTKIRQKKDESIVLPPLPISSGEIIVAAIAACGRAATYTAIRASNRMAALQYISDNAKFIADMETTNPEILCLYSNSVPLEGASRLGCEQSIFSTDGKLSNKFSTIQLYVEESLLFFVESNRMEKQYQFSFYGGLPYWRQDFSADPTGAISFYVISRELDQAGSLSKVDPQSLACLEYLTGVKFEGLCPKFKNFIRGLGEAAPQSIVKEPCGRMDDLEPFRSRASEEVCRPTWWYKSFRGGVPTR